MKREVGRCTLTEDATQVTQDTDNILNVWSDRPKELLQL